jgi:hypothetical protein
LLHRHNFANYLYFLAVGVAQLVELLVVAQVAVGSSPITHPIKKQGHCSASVAMAFFMSDTGTNPFQEKMTIKSTSFIRQNPASGGTNRNDSK